MGKLKQKLGRILQIINREGGWIGRYFKDMKDEEEIEIIVFFKLLEVLELKKRLLGQSFQMPVKPELQKLV